ncbi:MAG: hypothetical protein ACFB0E_09845 [Leptolyngbyaceae cyanobacterium]
MAFNHDKSTAQTPVNPTRLPWVESLKHHLKALGQFMTHHPDYQPAEKTRSKPHYSTLARVSPFCPPMVEQKAWLEEQYRAPSYPTD